jgi:hypothetical protein
MTLITQDHSPSDPSVASLGDFQFVVLWSNADTTDLQGRFISNEGEPRLKFDIGNGRILPAVRPGLG